MINLTNEDINLLESRIIAVCKQTNTDFTINSNQLVKNINLVYNTNYSLKEVNYVLGFIYEQQFLKC